MDINCNIAGDLLAPYLDGTCSEDTRNLLEAHLRGCDACREKLRRMRGEEEMSAEAEASVEEIRRNLTVYAKKVTRRRLRISALSAVLGLIAVCGLTLVGLTVQDMRRTAAPPVFSVPPEDPEPDADTDMAGAAWDPSRWEGVYDLTAGPLETTAGDVGTFELFTNNASIAVELTGEDREVFLWNVEYPEHPIQFSGTAPHVFEGLSAAWRYRVTVDAPAGTPVTVTDGRAVSFWTSFRRVIREIFYY